MNQVTREQLPYDSLTGAMTERHFLRRVEEEVARANELREELTLVSIAIDGLKGHCEKFGEDAGDAARASIAAVVCSQIRSFDVIGRTGLDQLSVLLVRTVANNAYVWGEKVRKLAAGQVIAASGTTFSATISVGICGLLDGMSAEDLVNGTERTLTKAVEHGGNLVRVQ